MILYDRDFRHEKVNQISNSLKKDKDIDFDKDYKISFQKKKKKKKEKKKKKMMKTTTLAIPVLLVLTVIMSNHLRQLQNILENFRSQVELVRKEKHDMSETKMFRIKEQRKN